MSEFYDLIVSQTGLIGVLFVLVVGALVWRDRELTKERAGRLSDAKHLEDVIEAQTRATTAANAAAAEQTRVLARLTESVLRSCAMQERQ